MSSAQYNDIKPSIINEFVIFAQRSDITEEIHRLESHLTEFKNTINRNGEAGKKLDFVTQEMLREANTIGTKANDADITYDTIALKSEIEKLKEQVQNIE
ncbi:MAG: DUF1732 domain-containing protein [Planctomycetes bacterium]|nr:DUF1732 domain-containing protein [Planctomycetota bacterium]